MTARAPFRSFFRRRDGVAAVEFALVLPVMLILLVGVAEIGQALTANRKVDRLASTIGDLVAREGTTNSSKLDGIFQLAQPMLEPFSADGIEILVADIKFIAGGGGGGYQAVVRWAHGQNTTAPACGAASPVTIPASLMPTNATEAADFDLVVARVVYPYRSPFAGILANVFGNRAFDLEHEYILRPRFNFQEGEDKRVRNDSAPTC